MSLLIVSAVNGGYIVQAQVGAGYAGSLLYAGNLDDCLDFIRAQMLAQPI